VEMFYGGDCVCRNSKLYSGCFARFVRFDGDVVSGLADGSV